LFKEVRVSLKAKKHQDSRVAGRTVPTTFLLALLFCLGVWLQPIHAIPQGASGQAFEFVPGVVVDPSGDRVFLMSPERSIDAVSLATGALLWNSDEAAKPLGMHGDLLIAQVESASGLEVALLDPSRSGTRQQTIQIELPNGLFSRVDDSVGHSFEALATVRSGTPILSWHSRARYTGGVAPDPGDALVQEESSSYSLDFAAGRALSIDPTDFVETEPSLPPNVRTWSNSAAASLPATRAGGILAGTEIRAGRERIVLKRWDANSGAPLSDVELFSGPHILELPSVDGSHLLISERIAPGDFEEYEWSIFSLATGERIGQVRHHQSHAPFYVLGQTVLYEARPFGRLVADEWQDEPRKLHAVLFGSGATVWEMPLRDTSYKGQVPP
jgi:hypothetical protein